MFDVTLRKSAGNAAMVLQSMRQVTAYTYSMDVIVKMKGMKMHFAIDIDGTIAYRNTAVYLASANRRLKLGLDEAILATMSTEEFNALPETEAYKESVGILHFDYVMGWITFDPEHLRSLIVIPGARDGVQRLSNLGDVTYYTARLVPALPSLSTKIADATYEWLATNNFPMPQNVVFCDGCVGKLRQIADLIRSTGESVVLIDDLAAILVNDLMHLDEESRALLETSLTLCPFSAIVEQCSLSLPKWNNIDNLIESLMTEGAHHGRSERSKERS